MRHKPLHQPQQPPVVHLPKSSSISSSTVAARQYLPRQRREHRHHHLPQVPLHVISLPSDNQHFTLRRGAGVWRTGRAIPACLFFRNLSPAATGSGTASSLEIGGGIREGVATRDGEASSGPASSRETSRSGIGNRRDVGHGPRGVGHPRLTSPGGCGSVRRRAGPPTPFPSFSVPGRAGPRGARVRGAVRGVQRSSRPCPLEAPPHSGPRLPGAVPPGVSRPRPSPRRAFTVRWCRRVGTASAHIIHILSRRSPAPPTTRSPTRTLSFYFVATTPDFPTHRVL